MASNYRRSRISRSRSSFRSPPCTLAIRSTFLTQLTSVNIRSKEFSNTLTKILASQEGMNAAMSLQGDDALTLVGILDQVSRLDDNWNILLISRVGFRGSKYGSRPPEKVRSHPPESLWLAVHPSAFLHTLGEYLQGGGYRHRLWGVYGCLERAPQPNSCVYQGVPRPSARESVKNQTGT